MQFYYLPLQSLIASDVYLIASSMEHHPRLRELTVSGECSEWSKSLVKGAVEGMARRHGVEKLAVTPTRRFQESEYIIISLIHCHPMHVYCYVYLICPLLSSLIRRMK